MSINIQLVIGILAVICVLAICNLVRRNRLDLRYGLIWILVGICIAVLDFSPRLLDALTRFMGIELPINMLFFLGFCLSLIIMFGLTKTISDLVHKVKRLTQEMAILQKRIEELTDEKEN